MKPIYPKLAFIPYRSFIGARADCAYCMFTHNLTIVHYLLSLNDCLSLKLESIGGHKECNIAGYVCYTSMLHLL